MNDIITLVARETGWTLEYIRALPVSLLQTLANEIVYQRAVESYQQAYNSALIVCTLASTKSKHYRPSEIIGDPPERSNMSQTKLAKDPKSEKLKANGVEYSLAPLTANMMAEAEDRFDKAWEELMASPIRKRPLIFVLYLRLRPNYPDLTEEQVGDLMTDDLECING